jgi:hemerythrin-like domain-containing protein
MASATAILRKEHDAILRMLEATDEVARRIGRGERVKPETLSEILEFFRLFADRCHHGKEEDLLFPLLEKKGILREAGPIGVMLFEHEEGRALMRQMELSADAHARGVPAAAGHWASAAQSYVALLSGHIAKENNVLFPMAERLLSDAEQQILAEAFERIEEEKMGVGTHQRLHARMECLLTEISQNQT